MKRLGMLGAWGFCVGLAIGCGGRSDNRAADEARDNDDIDIADTTTLTETGCLTAAGDRFVLTALEGGGGAPQTELYQLVGSGDELRKHVGREVSVTGVAEPAQVAELRESSPATPTGTAGADGDRPQVQTQTQTRLETRRMRVATVTATGDECVADRR
jgi:hypothetical protein